MTNTFHNPVAISSPLGLYSHVAVDSTTGLVFVAGQLSVDAAGQLVGHNDMGKQLAVVFENIGSALASVGRSHDDIVLMTTYLTDRSLLDAFFAAREELFPRVFTRTQYPPNTLVIGAGLVLPAALIEVQVIASGSPGIGLGS